MMFTKKEILKSIPLICLMISGCGEKKHEKVEIIKPVKMITVGKASDNMRISYPARIEANKYANLSFNVDGTIEKVFIKPGDKVKAGQVLARLDQQDYISDVKIAQARLKEAKLDYERYSELVKVGASSRADYETRVKNYEVAQSGYKIAEKALNDTTLKAPFDGVIAKKFIEAKQNVKAKQKVFLIQGVNKVDVSINIPEQDIARARQGLTRAEIEKLLDPLVTFPVAPNKHYKIKIKEFREKADPITQTFKVTFEMDSPKDIVVRPDMTAKVSLMQRFFRGMGGKGVEIPFTSVFLNDKGEKCVWVVEKDMTVTAVKVKTGELNKGKVVITSGLKAGDEVVTTGADTLSEGMKVRKIVKIGI